MDFACGMMEEQRAESLKDAYGDVLEIGFGTGRNLPHYPSTVKSLAALDPIQALEGRVTARIATASFPVERFPIPASAKLPFPDGRFDCVVSTWTICSIDEPEKALQELRRVLKPGGIYLFIEHGCSHSPRVAAWQKRMNPMWKRLFCGCRLDLKPGDLIRKAGFQLTRFDTFVMPGRSSFSDQLYRGVART
jgi:ubiquinone/menaquinone biosynthesis C-methylase UbiE